MPTANQREGIVLLLNENSSIISKLPAHQDPVFASTAICFGGKLKIVFLAYNTRAKYKSECILCESKRRCVIQFIGSLQTYSLKLGLHLADTFPLLLLIHRGAAPAPICFRHPLPAIPTPENWFPWLPLCAALRIYGGGWESYIKSCLLSSTYYLMLETEMLDGPPYRLPVFPPQGVFICPESSF